MLRQRILSAVLLLPLVLIATYLGGAWFFALVALAALVAGYEFALITRHAGYAPSLPLLLGMIALLFVSIISPFPKGSLAGSGQGFREGTTLGLTWLALAVSLVLTFAWQVFLPDEHRSLLNWALTLGGGLYLGILAGHLVLLRDLPDGLGWTLWMFLGTWANDSGAYLAGKSLGRHKFSPRLSPHKTWEGSVGGWLSALVVSLAVGAVLRTPAWQAALLGIVLGPMATLGDLSVSFLKRQTGVKDTGNVIPGHGGILDRLDSLLFSAVAVYYWVIWRL